MSYISFEFLGLVVAYVALYYLLPLRQRWIASLVASCAFYWMVSAGNLAMIGTLLGMTSIAYGAALWIEASKNRGTKKVVLATSICLLLALLAVTKIVPFAEGTPFADWAGSLVVPIGLSFLSLQLVAYVTDVYRRKVKAQRNFLRHLLFTTYFPHVIQGPIPRYGRLARTLLGGSRFRERNISHGFSLIVWGIFLKLMIADKAAVMVNEVFGSPELYTGWFVFVAVALYSLQLYADFMACTRISQGVARLVGIELAENFDHPYASASIGEFWRRWHISLSSWLKDYVYIPLGGSRKGAIRKYLNITVVFLVSGVWHGDGIRFLAWGALHALYQVAEGILERPRRFIERHVGLEQGTPSWRIVRWVPTMLAVMLGWLVFRAPTLDAAGEMLASMFSCNNAWIFLDGQLEGLGLGAKGLHVLVLSVLLLVFIERYEMANGSICKWVSEQHLVVRWALHLVTILAIWVLGTYGLEFDAAEFIYGGF